MADVQWSLVLGVLTVGLGLGAARFPLLAWVTLAPLGVAAYRLSPMLAALAGAVAGASLVGSVFVSRTMRPILPIAGGSSAVSWGLSSALVAALWPDGEPAWGALLIPAFGSDLFVTAATGTSAAIVTLLVVETPPRASRLLAAALAAVVVVGALAYAWRATEEPKHG